jgi:hypothetical protein
LRLWVVILNAKGNEFTIDICGFLTHSTDFSGHTDAVTVKKEVPHMEERKNAKTEQNTNEQNTQNANKNAKNTKNAKNCK